ncbi:RNA-binding domain-containing protein, partial [Obba rivulosa]
VGNVPYGMMEPQLIDVFKTVGTVIGFRLVTDRDTGESKGYGFCEFADHETALCAVHRIDGQEVGRRQLRVSLADSDPFLEGKTTVRGELIEGSETPTRRDLGAGLAGLPPGVPVPSGTTATDMINETLATVGSMRVIEVLSHMKAFVITHPKQAHALLRACPQLSYALVQALRPNNLVSRDILQVCHALLISSPLR